METLLNKSREKIMQKPNSFELLGCDFVVDNECKVHLIEVNLNPALFTDCEVQKHLLPKLVADTLDLVLGNKTETNLWNQILLH